MRHVRRQEGGEEQAHEPRAGHRRPIRRQSDSEQNNVVDDVINVVNDVINENDARDFS